MSHRVRALRFGIDGRAVWPGGVSMLPGKPTAALTLCSVPQTFWIRSCCTSQNCAGCHGADGKLGPAPPIGDPVYLADGRRRHAAQHHLEGKSRNGDVGLRAKRRRHADRQAGGRHRSGHAAALGPAADLAGCDSPAVRGQGSGQSAAGSGGLCDLLRFLSWRGRQGNGEGRLHRESELSQPDHRSGTCGRSSSSGGRTSTRPTGETTFPDIR